MVQTQDSMRAMEKDGLRLFGQRNADPDMLEEPLRSKVQEILSLKGWSA